MGAGRDFETALAEALREGEEVQGEFRVSAWLHVLSSWRHSCRWQLSSLLAVGIAVVVLADVRRAWRSGLPWLGIEAEAAIGTLVSGLFVLVVGGMLTKGWIDSVSARCVLTDARFLQFRPAGGWQVKGAVELSRCQWLFQRGVLTIWGLTERGSFAAWLDVSGLLHDEELQAALQQLAGPPAGPEERDAALGRLYGEDRPEAALTRVFRRPVEPTWKERPPGVWGLDAGSALCGPWRHVAGGLWCELQVPALPMDPGDALTRLPFTYQVVRALPLQGLAYVVHAGVVFVPQAPLALDPVWTQGDADTPALLAAALAERADPGPFDRLRWHPLHRATHELLRALDAAGARRVA